MLTVLCGNTIGHASYNNVKIFGTTNNVSAVVVAFLPGQIFCFVMYNSGSLLMINSPFGITPILQVLSCLVKTPARMKVRLWP